MARNRRGQVVNGWIVLDKPLGLTSTQAVGRVRRVFDARKVGHGGTLDPLASGVLPIALGEATKTIPYLLDGRKKYRFRLRWGQATATDDAEGEVIAHSPHRPGRDDICRVLDRFIGAVEQVPPRFSAIKVDGKRAYDLARAAADFDLKSRLVQIDAFDLISADEPDSAVFEVTCGKGTYMRSLARDLGLALGTLAHIIELRRLSVASFDESVAISLESLESLRHSPAALEQLLPVETALDDIPVLALSGAEANRLRCGQNLSMVTRLDSERVSDLSNGAIVFTVSDGKPVALARYDAGDIRPVRVLNL